MANNIRWGLDNPHPFSQMKTELIWEGKYDEYGNRRTVDIAGCAMPLQKIETIDEPASRAMVQGNLFDPVKAHRDDFRNRLIWGDNKLVMASLLKEFARVLTICRVSLLPGQGRLKNGFMQFLSCNLHFLCNN
jgi:hypothetical protein